MTPAVNRVFKRLDLDTRKALADGDLDYSDIETEELAAFEVRQLVKKCKDTIGGEFGR